MAKEPTAIVTALTMLLTSLFGVAAAYGLHLSDAQQNAILKCIPPVVVIIGLMGAYIRSLVVSPHAAGEAVAIAKELHPESDVVPDVQVKGYRHAAAMKLGRPQSRITWKPPVDAHEGTEHP